MCRPAHAVHFAAYEACKKFLNIQAEEREPMKVAIAGSLATISSDAVMLPADVVKQRLQVRCAAVLC